MFIKKGHTWLDDKMLVPLTEVETDVSEVETNVTLSEAETDVTLSEAEMLAAPPACNVLTYSSY